MTTRTFAITCVATKLLLYCHGYNSSLPGLSQPEVIRLPHLPPHSHPPHLHRTKTAPVQVTNNLSIAKSNGQFSGLILGTLCVLQHSSLGFWDAAVLAPPTPALQPASSRSLSLPPQLLRLQNSRAFLLSTDFHSLGYVNQSRGFNTC